VGHGALADNAWIIGAPRALPLREEPRMGNRLTQIATRTGDAGTTGLGNNQRVS